MLRASSAFMRSNTRALLARSRQMGSSTRFASSLVVAEHDSGSILPSTLAVVSAAKKIGGDVNVLVVGSDEAAKQAASIDGVSAVLNSSPAVEGGISERIAEIVLAAQAAKSSSHVLVAASNNGKNFAPRVAAKLDVQQISDITGVVDENTFERPTYAGNAMSKVKSNDSVKVITVRPTSFEKSAASGGSASVEAFEAPEGGAIAARFISEEKTKSDRPALDSAPTVVSGGRGLKSGENFEMLYKLADKLGAGVGASRAAVDAGYVPNDMQVGQTGKVVAPELYVAVGISGAIQHLAGMKDSKTIVAINKDPEAPIFQVADYGLVEDLFKAVPDLTEKV